MTDEQIWEKINTLEEEDLAAWIKGLPDDEAIEAMRKIGEIAKKNPLFRQSAEFREQIKKAEEKTDAFEDSVLQEKVAELKNEVIIDGHLKELDEIHQKIKRELLNAIKNKPEDAEKLKEMARGMMQIDKDHHLYNPDEWKDWEGII